MDNLQGIGEYNIHQPHHRCPPNQSVFALYHLEKLSESPTFSKTNKSSAAHGSTASEGRPIDSIKMKTFGLHFAPATQSILIDNNVIHATEVALGKFLSSQIDDVTSGTITAVDVEFLPHS